LVVFALIIRSLAIGEQQKDVGSIIAIVAFPIENL
jgi:hypothetical protein